MKGDTHVKRLRLHSRSSGKKQLDFGKFGSKLGRRVGSSLGRRVGARMGKKLAKKYLPGLTWKLAGTLFPGFPMEAVVNDLFRNFGKKRKVHHLLKTNNKLKRKPK